MKTKTITFSEEQLELVISSLNMTSAQTTIILKMDEETKTEKIQKLEELVRLIDSIPFNNLTKPEPTKSEQITDKKF